MIVDQQMTIDAPIQQVWEFMLDIPSVAGCVPGVQSVSEGGDDSYIGAMKVKVGPIGATLEGRVKLVEQDPETRQARMDVEAADKRLRSAVNAQMSMRMEERAVGSTEVFMHTNASVLGKLGEFGQAVMKRKANQILEEFARNVERQLTAGRRPASEGTPSVPQPSA